MRKNPWINGVCALLLAGAAGAEELPRPDLAGTVAGEDGRPVSDATVLIYTAVPRTGSAQLCPSCYPDCTKKVSTDLAGRFEIEALDPALLFKLLVVAGGREATFVEKVDPRAGEVEVVMKSLDQAALKAPSRISGVVMDPAGQPVVGAVLSVEGIERPQSTRWGPTREDADPLAVTDDRGFFSLYCAPDILRLHALLDSQNLAKNWVSLKMGQDHMIWMKEGASVTGQVLRDGRPVERVAMAMVTRERRAGVSLHDFESVTDDQGRFLITKVTPGRDYYIYSKMSTVGGDEVVPLQAMQVDLDAAVLDLGELHAQPAHTVSGRIVLSDSGTIPSGTTIFLGRNQAWDHAEKDLDEAGRFEFRGVPPESISLSVRLKGYRFSQNNPSLDWMNGGIVGKVMGDMNSLILEMEPGSARDLRETDDLPPGKDRQPREKPLRGFSARE